MKDFWAQRSLKHAKHSMSPTEGIHINVAEALKNLLLKESLVLFNPAKLKLNHLEQFMMPAHPVTICACLPPY